jgi:hypothetical protein
LPVTTPGTPPETLGIPALRVNPAPVMDATEAAPWGSVKAHGFLPDIVSDDAGQFNVGHHGLCWVHSERLVPSSTPSPTTTASPRPPFAG